MSSYIVNLYPDIARLLSEYNAFWEVLRFTEGKPVYTITAEITAPSIHLRGLPYYLSFIRQMCKRYNGIAYDEERDQCGLPTLRRLIIQEDNEQRIRVSLGWEWPVK